MEYNTAKQFGERLKELRHKRCMTMDVVSEAIGISRSTYAGYETQNRYAPIENLTKIALKLDASIDYLVGLTDREEPSDMTRDIGKYLTYSDLNWNGIPLSDDDVKVMRDVIDIIMRDRASRTIID